MPNAFSSNDFLSICLQSNGFAHMCCHMHFKVMIFWAFALKQMILYIFDVHLGGSICLWVSMTTLNSENITLFSDSVTQRGWGSNCLWVSLTTLNSKEITLSSASVDWEGSICLWCLYLYICTGISLYFPYICLWVSMTTLNICLQSNDFVHILELNTF